MKKFRDVCINCCLKEKKKLKKYYYYMFLHSTSLPKINCICHQYDLYKQTKILNKNTLLRKFCFIVYIRENIVSKI